MIRRVGVLAYGVVAYAAFLVTLLYAIGFLAGTGVPKDVDDGPRGPVALALLVDAGLLTVFAVQHSLMARPWFKRRWTRIVAPSIERSTYVLFATAALALVLWQWRPIPDQVWRIGPAPLAAAVAVIGALGWALLVWSTFLLGHFDLFGLRQVLARARERSYQEPGFVVPWLYTLVRHPLMTGFLIAFWATPQMSAGRLLFVAASTGYILVGVRLEEHDLKRQLGEPYRQYVQQVPRFVPHRASQQAPQRVSRPA